MRIKNQILRALKKEDRTFWELINSQDAHIIEYLQNLNELLSEGIISYDGYKFSLKKEIDINPEIKVNCHVCEVGVEIKDFFLSIYEKFLEITQDRPLPISDYDQGFIRPIDTIRRLCFMYARGDLENMKIFILGDDDLLSVAIGLTNMAEFITVFEIDERIIDFIEKFCEDFGINNIYVKRYNVLDELPKEEKGRYDVFVTDPVETHKGFKAFVGRCIETLSKKGSSGYVGLTHREASLKKWYEFQKFLLDANFAITDILRDFTIYPEKENKWETFYQTYELMKKMKLPMPEVDWYKSSFIRFEAVDNPIVPEFDFPKNLEELYFDEESWATPKPKFLEKGEEK